MPLARSGGKGASSSRSRQRRKGVVGCWEGGVVGCLLLVVGCGEGGIVGCWLLVVGRSGFDKRPTTDNERSSVS